MKFILIVLLLLTNIYAGISVKQKKKNFIDLVYPAIEKVHNEYLEQYDMVHDKQKRYRNLYKIEVLKEKYNVKTDEELLKILKPFPKSITLAQAAIESAWGTSRFFKQANNIFGMWSYNKNEPRIAANEKRAGRTIWIKKFNTLEESIRAYYKLLATKGAYREFRELKMKTENTYLLVQKLDRYCELKQEYCNRLDKLIKYNNFNKYD